jgi:hypothetical protein
MRLQEEAGGRIPTRRNQGGVQAICGAQSVDYSDREPNAVLAPERSANLSFFFSCDSPAVRRYRLDLAAPQASARRIVSAAGQSASESAPYKAAEALARGTQ